MDAQHKAIIAQSTADNAQDRVGQAFVDIKVNTSAINELNDRVTVNTKDISDLKNKFNGEFKSIYDKIEENKKEYKAGIASAMAMTSIPQAFNSGSGLLGIGAATYKGQSAIAIGGSKVSENGRWITKFSVSSNSQYDYGAGLGFGYQF